MARPATIPERDLVRECSFVDGALLHGPTGIRWPLSTHATDAQRQRALWLLRLQLAATIRSTFDGNGLANAWWRDRGDPSRLRRDLAKHRDFPAFASLALDALAHRDWRLKGAAGALELRPWSLHRAVGRGVLLREINARRAERRLKSLAPAGAS